MHLPALRLLTQPILQTALAAATIIAAALVLAKRAEAKPARIPVDSPRNQRRRSQ
jgi:hypothetical protein